MEESLFERKKREQQEESKAVEERRGIAELRLRCKMGEKREIEETNIFQRVAKRKKQCSLYNWLKVWQHMGTGELCQPLP